MGLSEAHDLGPSQALDAVLGVVYGRRVGQGPLLATATAGVDAALGALVVVAKVVAG